MKSPYYRSGFTLLELLVVIAVIGFLTSISIVALSASQSSSRDKIRLQHQQQVIKAVELYMNDFGVPPQQLCTDNENDGNCDVVAFNPMLDSHTAFSRNLIMSALVPQVNAQSEEPIYGVLPPRGGEAQCCPPVCIWNGSQCLVRTNPYMSCIASFACGAAAPNQICGDALCQGSETPDLCPDDCMLCNNDSICDVNESIEYCSDCALCNRNCTCESGETVSTCSYDCGLTPSQQCQDFIKNDPRINPGGGSVGGGGVSPAGCGTIPGCQVGENPGNCPQDCTNYSMCYNQGQWDLCCLFSGTYCAPGGVSSSAGGYYGVCNGTICQQRYFLRPPAAVCTNDSQCNPSVTQSNGQPVSDDLKLVSNASGNWLNGLKPYLVDVPSDPTHHSGGDASLVVKRDKYWASSNTSIVKNHLFCFWVSLENVASNVNPYPDITVCPTGACSDNLWTILCVQ